MKLITTYLSMHIRSQLQDRASMILLFMGQFLFTLMSFITIIVLVPNNVEILGYNQEQILFSTAIINLSYALGEFFARGFDQMETLIISGKYDTIAMRPMVEVLQIALQTCDFSRFGRLSISLAFLIHLLMKGYQNYTVYILYLALCGALVYGCLFIIYGSICFYTTKNLEVFNILTDGTREFSKVPLIFYGDKILFVLTFIIPLSLVQYYPLLYIFKKNSNPYLLLVPMFSFLIIIPTILFWTRARKHYASVGS